MDTVNCEIPLWHNVCAIVLVLWDCRLSSITNVCLSATSPTSDKHTYTEMRSDSVMCACPLALHTVRVWECVCVCSYLCVLHRFWLFGHGHQCVRVEVTLRVWVVTAVCRLIGWLRELFTLHLCAQWRGTDPLQTAASASVSHHIQRHICTIIPHALAWGLVTMQTTSTLAGALPGQKYGVLYKLTDVGHVGGNWLNKLKYYSNAFT